MQERTTMSPCRMQSYCHYLSLAYKLSILRVQSMWIWTGFLDDGVRFLHGPKTIHDHKHPKGSSYARLSAIHSLWIWVRQIFLFKGCQRFPGSRDMDGFALLTCQLAKSPICLWLLLEHSPPHNTGLARQCFVRRCFWCGTHWLLLFSVCLTWCSWAR